MNTSVLHKVRVAGIIIETSLAKTFVLQPLDGWQPAYKPGQFITLLLYNTGTEKRRSYSIVSPTSPDGLLYITVKRVVNGEYSCYMLDRVLIGDEFYTTGISGFFTLPDEKPDDTNQLFFLAAGSGITPVFSLISTALKQWELVSVRLIYSNRNEDDVIFFEQLVSLEQQYNQRFKIEWLFSNSLDIYTSRLSNYLLNILLKKYNIRVSNTLFYMCGPFDYMLMIRITLLIYGASIKNIFKEQFSSIPRIIKPLPPDIAMHNVTIHIEKKVYNVEVQYPATILSAAKSLHITLPYSCEAGSCGSCVATCTSGKIWLACNEVLTDDEIAKGRILVCQAYPIGGDTVIEYD